MSNIRASIHLTVLALALGRGIPVFGQESPNVVAASRDAAAADEDSNDLPQTDVVIDGKTLFSVRGVRAHPAERRPEEIENRIEAVAGNSKIDANSLTLEDHPEGTWIMADSQRILAVLNCGCDPDARAFLKSRLTRSRVRLQALTTVARNLFHVLYGIP